MDARGSRPASRSRRPARRWPPLRRRSRREASERTPRVSVMAAWLTLERHREPVVIRLDDAAVVGAAGGGAGGAVGPRGWTWKAGHVPPAGAAGLRPAHAGRRGLRFR